MATSGKFTGGRGGGSTGPYLTLDWDVQETDVSANRSKVRLTLKLVADYAIYFSANKSGSVEGNSFTYTNGMNGSGTKTLKTLDVWVNHNSDGTLTTNFSASFNIAISYGGSNVGSLSVSGNATLDTIPRASDFTISGSTLGSPVTVTISRASGSFTHKVIYDLPDGDRRNDWSDIGTSYTFTPSLADAQYIKNSTSGKAKITVQTYSGSTMIGSKAKTFTLNVPSSVVPTASGLTTAIYGSGRDKTLNKYIQGISKVTASFTTAMAYGATVKSTSITVKRQSDNGNSQTISGTSGTTSNPLSLSGTYIVTASVTDSRGRTATTSKTITVDAYSPPKISKFDVARGTPSTTVTAAITASWSLGTSNPTDILIKSVDNAAVTKTLYTLNDSTAGTFSSNQSYTAQADSSAYIYTITVTDSFGKVATASITVGTTFIELTISKGKGIGVGKVHEKGALDVAGQVYVDGTIHLPKDSFRSTSNGGGLNGNNGDIYSLNGIWFGDDGSDLANNNGEGLLFPRTSTPADSRLWSEWDNFRVMDGTAYLNSIPIGTSDDPVLWTGAYYMTAGHSVVPKKKLSECPGGWVLVWSRYASGATTDNLTFSFIPKSRVKVSGGGGIGLVLRDNVSSISTKYIYVNDTTISGHDQNDDDLNVNRALIAVHSF